MNFPPKDERPQLRSLVSQQIVALELELYSLSPRITELERALQRKAELERRVSFLRDMERSGER